MPANTVARYGNGSQVKFEVPGSLRKLVFVNGVLTVPAAQDYQSVTLSSAPGVGVPIEIDYDSQVGSQAGAVVALDNTGALVGLVDPKSGSVIALSVVVGLSTANTAAAASANVVIIQAALDVGGQVSISTPGTYLINAPLQIPSNTAVYIAAGVTIKVIANTGQSNIFVNKNTQTGDVNIGLYCQGILDSNYLNIGATISDTRLMTVRFTNVTNLAFIKGNIINNLKYAVLITKCNKFIVRDVDIQAANVGADGVHVHGNSSNGLIENISGQSGDDFIALNVKDVSNWLDPITPALSIGPIKNITVRKITGTCVGGNSGSPVAVYTNVTGTTTPITNATWATGQATITSTLNPVVGTFVQITGMTPVGYNGVWRVLASTAGTFTFLIETTPGTFVSSGAVDTSYELSGIVIDDVKSPCLNNAPTINLTSFASPSQGGCINDVSISNVKASGTGRVITIGVSIATLNVSTIRPSLTATGEIIFADYFCNHEWWTLRDIKNDVVFTGSLGGAIVIRSPVRVLQCENIALKIGTTISGIFLDAGSTSTAMFETIEITNYSCEALQGSLGIAGLELGNGSYPRILLNNFAITNLVSGIKGNGATKNTNLSINGAQARNPNPGSGFIQIYGTGTVWQISVLGFVVSGSGTLYFLINNSTGGSVTMVKASGIPNYTSPFNWFDPSTPGAGSQLFCDGHEIRVDLSKVVRQVGAMLTSPGNGTIVNGNVAICDGTGTTNSWKQLSNTTLTY